MNRQRIEDMALTPVLQGVRKAIYMPMIVLAYLPGGPIRYMWAVRAMCWVDQPFRTYLIRKKVSGS
jgi:hypothetical protein